jgi:ribosomal protein L10
MTLEEFSELLEAAPLDPEMKKALYEKASDLFKQRGDIDLAEMANNTYEKIQEGRRQIRANNLERLLLKARMNPGPN